MNYPRIVAGLAYNATAPGLAEAFATAIGEPGSGEFQKTNWFNELDSLSKSHRFEFNDDVSFLLTMTDNDIDGDYHLPYPITFLDCTFMIPDPKGNMTYHGVLLTEGDRVSIAKCTDGRATYTVVSGHQPNEVAVVEKSFITCTAYIHTKPGLYYIDARYPIGIDNKELNQLVNEQLETQGLPRMGTLEIMSYSNKEKQTLEAITANFLDLLNSHDVTIAHVPQSKPTMGRDHKPNPPRHIVRLSLPLTEYIHSVTKGPHSAYSHAFWVRGHWKHWKDDRYARSGKQGTKTWVPPYIKGMNELIQKKYDAVTNYAKH